MKLKATVDTLDGIDEKYHDLYTQVGDKFILQVEGFREHPDVTALANAHDRTKTANRTLTTELDTLKERVADLPEDFDPDLYRRAVEEGVGGGGGEPKDAEQIRKEAAEAATRRAEDKAQKELDKANNKAALYKGRLETKLKTEAINEALDDANVTDPALRKGARAILMPLVEIHEDGDEMVPLAKSPEYGDTIPVAEHVKAWAQTDEGKAYVSARESAGGGAKGGPGGGTPPANDQNPFKPGPTFNATEQARLRREDPATADRLAREAGVKITPR